MAPRRPRLLMLVPFALAVCGECVRWSSFLSVG